jgi:hypothetical protein
MVQDVHDLTLIEILVAPLPLVPPITYSIRGGGAYLADLSCSENKAASDHQHPAGTLGRQDDGGPYYIFVIQGAPTGHGNCFKNKHW